MIVNVKLNENIKLENIKFLLSKYRDYKAIERELKINSILGNKCQLEVSDIDPPIYSGFDVDRLMSLKKAAFVINEFLVTIDKDLNISEIILEVKILDTPEGRILNNLINMNEIIFEPCFFEKEEIKQIFNIKVSLNKIAA